MYLYTYLLYLIFSDVSITFKKYLFFLTLFDMMVSTINEIEGLIIMWTRELLKRNAKQILQRTYGMSFVACLIYGFLSGGVSNVISRISTMGNHSADELTDIAQNYSMIGTLPYTVLMGLMLIMMVFTVLGLIYSILVAMPVMVGYHRFFMASRTENPNLKNLFFSFTCGRYMNILKTMFLQSLYITLWSMLFVIPGIIKSYEYYFIPYLMAENPDMDAKRAFELSRMMTEGKKMDIFVLNLSFIGWYLLGALACGVGVLFVIPYQQATDTELYMASRAALLQSGMVSPSELPGNYNHIGIV